MTDMTLHARFRSERLRLGLSHQRTADLAGYSRGSVISWEKGTSLPAAALERLAAFGMDVQYVVSGIRSANLRADLPVTTAAPEGDLTKPIHMGDFLLDRPTAERARVLAGRFQSDLTAAFLDDMQVLVEIQSKTGIEPGLRDHALYTLSALRLSDNDWLRLLGLARLMTLIPSLEPRGVRPEGSS